MQILDGSKSFKNETRRACANAQTSVDEFRKFGQDGRVAASKDYTVFISKRQQRCRLPLHIKRGDFWFADMFLVDDINVVTTTDRLDSTAMWAMILGKRLATPSYLA